MTREELETSGKLVVELANMYNKEMTEESLVLWFRAIKILNYEEIKEAITIFLRSEDCKFFPMPGQLIKIINQKNKVESFYDSTEWKKLRYSVLLKNSRECMACGSIENIHVDHIKPRSQYPDLQLVEDNLQILCEPCNIGKGAWDTTDWRKEA
jgi:hypothetical protein